MQSYSTPNADTTISNVEESLNPRTGWNTGGNLGKPRFTPVSNPLLELSDASYEMVMVWQSLPWWKYYQTITFCYEVH